MVESYQNIPFFIVRKYFTTIFVTGIIALLLFVLYRNYMQFNSTVSITNSRWQKVHIQVKKPPRSGLERAGIIFDQYLVKGQSRSFTVDDSNDILYRRDLDPDHADGIHFTNWTHANNDGSAVCTIKDP